ncbi:MAG: hypothetical protein AAF127_11860 [Pseudomonadota bacterium]
MSEEAKAAEPGDWKKEPFGDTVALPFDRVFSENEFDRLSKGLIPRAMEDKWFIYMDQNQLFLHRSWTGKGVYRLAFQREDAEMRAKAEIAANSSQEVELEYEARLLNWLISNLLLGEDKPFPTPEGLPADHSALLQHHLAGKGHRTKPLNKRLWWRFWG